MELVMMNMWVIIQFSNFKARKAVVPHVRESIFKAKNAIWGLQRLASKIGRVVDGYAQKNGFVFKLANTFYSITVV